MEITSHIADCMAVRNIDDWEMRLSRQDAWWFREVIDRPPCCITFPKKSPIAPHPSDKKYDSYRERWMDTQRVVELAKAHAHNTCFCGDALPTAWPNLGPEVFSAFFGIELEYTAETAWAIPVVHDCSQYGKLKFSTDSFYFKKLVEMTDALLDAGKELFYVGLTDFHPGGDALAAFRDPASLCEDILLCPDKIKQMLDYVTRIYFEVYDFFYQKLRSARQPITCWAGIVSTYKWYVPSNDFSCMVSEETFRELFLPGIRQECQFYETSIYHLDGPAALRHLDALLDIPELNAIQWVYGAGHGKASDWIPVYKRCQQANKSIQIFASIEELEILMEHLRPEGVWLAISGVSDEDSASAVLNRLKKWK